MKLKKDLLKLVGIWALSLVVVGGIAVNADASVAKAAHQHDFITGKIIPATCTNVGGIQCGIAGCTDVQVLPALGHDYENGKVLQVATFDQHGYIQCGRCEARLTFNPAEHQLSDWVVDVAPTCEGLGHAYKTYLDRDQKVMEKTIPAIGHTLGDWVVDREAACADPGEKSRTCTTCGKKLVAQAIPATGHTYVTVEVKAPTATTFGLANVECSVCDRIFSQHPTPYVK